MIFDSHPASTLDGVATCPCGLRLTAKSAEEARRLSHAHIANPYVIAPVLLAFVRMAPPFVVPETDVDALEAWQ